MTLSFCAVRHPPRWLVLLGATLLFASAGARAELVVLASIKPLALIAQSVVGDRVRVDTLLPDTASPHDYPLRVSDVRRLQSANIVLWIGPEMESFLQRPLRNTPVTQQLLAQQLPGITWPTSGGHSHGEHSHHGHQLHHDRDPHLWLNPLNAGVVAQALAQRLAKIDPEGAAIFSVNAEEFVRSMTALDQRLMAELKPINTTGFAVYHEGYAHFIERYNLRQLAHVTFSPERRPGARHMHQLRQQLRGQAACLFAEPYYDMRLAEDLAQELELRLGMLDPLGGAEITSYSQLIEGMAHALLSCLQTD